MYGQKKERMKEVMVMFLQWSGVGQEVWVTLLLMLYELKDEDRGAQKNNWVGKLKRGGNNWKNKGANDIEQKNNGERKV